jgi:division protein CdvB (Snf7/Vps24/ESCRT-III family)
MNIIFLPPNASGVRGDQVTGDQVEQCKVPRRTIYKVELKIKVLISKYTLDEIESRMQSLRTEMFIFIVLG